MLQICDIANKFKTLKSVGVFFQYFKGNIFAKDLKSLALVCQNPERLTTILWFIINY